jgi:extradiol dioxygenase family protein
MQNLLILPLKTNKKTVLQRLDDFIKKYQAAKKQKYQKQVNFLHQQTYFWYLKKILKNDCSVDIPHFLYFNGESINMRALYLADMAIYAAEQKGKKHINKCYNACLKQV